MHYTLSDIPELLTFLNESERARMPAVIRRLMDSEDFRLLFRYMNQTCGGLHGAVFVSDDPIKCAQLDGSKAHVRELFDVYLATFHAKEPRPTEQQTELLP